MKYIKLFENFSLNEKKEPMSEVDHKALYNYLSPRLGKDGELTFDSESYKELEKSKGKKLDLASFIKVEKPSSAQLDRLVETLKKFEIGIFDESWANMISHPQDLITLDKYFIKKGVISIEQLVKMPDFQSTIKNAIESDPTTWNKQNYNKVASNNKYPDENLFSLVQFFSSAK
jgi:hypothetical protein